MYDHHKKYIDNLEKRVSVKNLYCIQQAFSIIIFLLLMSFNLNVIF